MIARIVIGSLFGDEGKGITTDFLCKEYPNKTIVVRFSGGQQAGHNVKLGKYSHVHSNFGSGTLRGVPSYFSEHCTVNPVTMLREYEILSNKISTVPNVFYHPLGHLTTPADIAYNRWRERKLQHGSCGIGVGATMKRNLETPHKLYVIDLLNISILLEKISQINEYYRNLIESNNGDLGDYEREFENEYYHFKNVLVPFSNWIKDKIHGYDFLNNYSNVIFEGSQGILLDMHHGVFPNVTYANTTSKNALEICSKLKNLKGAEIEIYYVTRCYQTRHGNGWMSDESSIELINTEHEINVFNEWQGPLRIGEIDYDLLNYVHSIDNIYSSGIKKNLVVTCLDQRPNFKLEVSKLSTQFDRILTSHSPESKDFKNFRTK